MTSFELVALGLAFILGIAITHILSSAIHVFRERRQHRVHLMPLVWALSIFLLQIQFWWAIFELSTVVPVWTVAWFGMLVMCALTLFAAGALVLPGRYAEADEDLLGYFASDGRWAVLALAAYHIEALVVNAVLFRSGPGHIVNVPVWIGLVLAASLPAVKRLGVRLAITIAYLVTIIVGVAIGSRGAY